MYNIEFTRETGSDLKALRPFDRRRVLDEIDARLTVDLCLESKNQKSLAGLVPTWEHVPPVQELRVGEHRVFYDVDELERRVVVRAVRRKPPHKTTEEIL